MKVSIPFKGHSIKNCAFSYYKQCSSRDSRVDITLFEIENICVKLISNLKESIIINDSSAILEVLENFNKFMNSCQFFFEFPSNFLLDLLNLLSDQNFKIQILSSNLILKLIISNDYIGFFFLENHIIDIINKQICQQNKLIIRFFPLIRVLSLLDNSVFQLIFNVIPLSLFQICFEIKELSIEIGLFLNNISCFQQTESIQNFILHSIRKIYEMGFKECFIYLACSLHQMSNFENFCFGIFRELKLDEFIDLSLKETKLHCALPICLFLSNLFKNSIITNLPKKHLKMVLKFSMDLNRPKRCEASIDLLYNILEYGDSEASSYFLRVIPFGQNFIEIIRNADINFTIKYKILMFLLSFASKISFEEFSQLIAFGFFEIFESILLLGDNYLIENATKLIVKSFHSFEVANTSPFYINSLKKSINLDLIESNSIKENELMNSFLLLLHKLIDGPLEKDNQVSTLV